MIFLEPKALIRQGRGIIEGPIGKISVEERVTFTRAKKLYTRPHPLKTKLGWFFAGWHSTTVNASVCRKNHRGVQLSPHSLYVIV